MEWLEKIVDENLLNQLENELMISIKKEASFHGTNEYKDYAMLLACPIYGGAFIKVLEIDNLWKPFNSLLGDSCITYVYTSSSMPPNKSNYSSRIHVDRPHFNPNLLESLGCKDVFRKQEEFSTEKGDKGFKGFGIVEIIAKRADLRGVLIEQFQIKLLGPPALICEVTSAETAVNRAFHVISHKVSCRNLCCVLD